MHSDKEVWMFCLVIKPLAWIYLLGYHEGIDDCTIFCLEEVFNVLSMNDTLGTS